MTAEVKSVTLDMKLRDAIILLLRHRVSGAPVVNNVNEVVSVISETDLLKLARMGLTKTVGECLSNLSRPPQLITLFRHSTFEEAYDIFMKKPIHRIIVVDGNQKLQGILTRGNVLRILVDLRHDKKSRAA